MISLKQVSVTYTETKSPTIANVNLEIEKGEIALLVGATGSGKTTLLTCLNGLVPHFTGGTLTGVVSINGLSTATHRPRDLASVVGYVGQDPSAGFIADTVTEELVYGLEQLGLSPEVMRRRLEEALDLLSLNELRDTNLSELSGGQQQRVAMAAALTAHPQILILDEPTSALDPLSAEEVLAAITRLAHDAAITVVFAEHRLERVLGFVDSVILIEHGKVRMGTPSEMLAQTDLAPPITQLGRWAGWHPLPLTVRDAVRQAKKLPKLLPPKAQPVPRQPPVLTARNLSVTYAGNRALQNINLQLSPGKVTAFMGRNGAGKSTLLWALQGTQPSQGELELTGIDPRRSTAANRRTLVSLVPQNPADLLYLPTIAAECAQADAESGAKAGSTLQIFLELVGQVPLEQHPRDLSEGQRLALVLAIQLVAEPQVLLLDEPTRGLDYLAKQVLAKKLLDLSARGIAIGVATHDVEFAAGVATDLVMLAGGEIIAAGEFAEVVQQTPAFAPQLTKVLGPGFLHLGQVQAAHVSN